MGEWERSALALTGAELEIQEALTALRRLLARPSLRPTTRVILDGALRALELEFGLG
jgi:hypothetical protein